MGFDFGDVATGVATGGWSEVYDELSPEPVPTPTMSEEEKALLQQQSKYYEEQAKTLQEYRDMLGQYYPVMLAQQGYKEDANGNLVALTSEEWQAQMNPMQQAQYQLAMQQVNSNNELLPLQMDMVKKQYQYMNEIYPQQLELTKSYGDYALKALKGELPLPQYLEDELGRQRQASETGLSARLGTGWRESTAGIQSEDAISRRIADIKSAYGHGEMTNLSQLYNQGVGGMQNTGSQMYGQYSGMPSGAAGYGAGNAAFNQAMGGYGAGLSNLAGGYGGVAGGYGAMQQPYQYYSGLEYKANAQNAANQAGMLSGLFNLGGTVGGAAIMGSSKSLKNNIRPVSTMEHERNLEIVRRMELVRYRYNEGIDDGKEHIGLIAEDAPESIASTDRKAIHLYDMVSVLTSAVKALTAKVEELQNGGANAHAIS